MRKQPNGTLVAAAQMSAADAPGIGSSGIAFYSAEACGACRGAERWLADNDVDSERCDVDEPRWAEPLTERTGRRALPVIAAKGRILAVFGAIGFERMIFRG